jgi:hypothetical protein
MNAMCGIEDTPALFQSANLSTFHTQGLRPWAKVTAGFQPARGNTLPERQQELSPGSKTLG